jgi:hypothetical protein
MAEGRNVMRNLVKAVNLAAGAFLLSAVLASAQGPRAAKNMRMYDPATETNLKGTVEGVTQQARGQMMGTHITIKTADETREVMLGPADFITGKGFVFATGDAVEVTGSKITMGAMEFVIARQVIKDGKTLTLRDKTGTPQWAGSGMSRKRAK